jgi:hypothetical protein
MDRRDAKRLNGGHGGQGLSGGCGRGGDGKETKSRSTLTFAKYLQMVSEAAPRSWLKGQALPAWQAPWRKNLHGTCDVSGRSKQANEVSARSGTLAGDVGGGRVSGPQRPETRGVTRKGSRGQGRANVLGGLRGML